jgi:hypothetical protein
MTTPAHEFPHAGPVDATIRVGAGLIDIVGADATSATVEVSPYDESSASRTAAAETRVAFDRGRLTVESPDRGAGGWIRRSGQVRVSVRLPQQSTVSVTTGSADIRLDGPLGAAEVQSGSGDLSAGHVAGDLTFRTGSGDIQVTEIGGHLRGHTGSGDVAVRLAKGPAEVKTASGDVTIDAADAAVWASTASGDVQVRTLRGDTAKVTTASGDVSVGVPAGTNVWLDLTTASGSTRSDLTMSDTPPADGAKLTLSVNTASGDIDVHRVMA